MRRITFILTFILLVTVLSACSFFEKSLEDVMKNVDKEHNDLSSFEVQWEEKLDDEKDTGKLLLDLKKETIYVESDELDLMMYKDKDDVLFIVSGIKVEQEKQEIKQTEKQLERLMKQYKNPFEYYKAYDKNFNEKLEMETLDDEYVITYHGDEKEQEEMLKAINEERLEALELEDSDLLDPTLKIKVTVDKESYRIKSLEEDARYTIKDEQDSIDFKYKLMSDYSKYNSVKSIKKPKYEKDTLLDGDLTPKEEQSSESGKDLTDKQKTEYEQEAIEYLDGLIQATIYQNADGFVDSESNLMSEKEKRELGEMEKELFKEIYIQNTKRNMEGSGVTDEQINDLADAFIKALSTTKYEILDATFTSDREVEITLEVEGIDDGSIYSEVDEELYRAIMDGKVEEEDLATVNIDMLIEKYNEKHDLVAPKKVKVYGIRNNDGTYGIMQDQFLIGGFVH